MNSEKKQFDKNDNKLNLEESSKNTWNWGRNKPANLKDLLLNHPIVYLNC